MIHKFRKYTAATSQALWLCCTLQMRLRCVFSLVTLSAFPDCWLPFLAIGFKTAETKTKSLALRIQSQLERFLSLRTSEGLPNLNAHTCHTGGEYIYKLARMLDQRYTASHVGGVTS
ncbi:hypothetical protein EDD22DRAFT_883335 [Suillus occidentalis]|nr:hypothetical protein EDD22DRAFT_883335 [Suillus occidentalis]